MSLSTKDYYYDLPKELIAQTPMEKRDNSRLFVLDENNNYNHRHFYDVLEYLKPGDVLVRNNTRVIPARIYGKKEETGANIEFLLLKRREIDLWEIILKPAKRTKVGTKIIFGEGLLVAEIVEVLDTGNRLVKFEFDGVFEDILDKIGSMPLPPYITEKLEDKERYQTVYSKVEGSAAAPTAGLHFTKELLAKIEDMGVRIVDVLLHVGLGTFRPVSSDNLEEHHMHSEYYEISEETAKVINEAKAKGNRIISIGTTSTRVLETVATKHGKIIADKGDTDIFIFPGYEFKVIDGLITNFHLPESTLIMMISALKTREVILKAYMEAVGERYRFFSFGDAMLILNRGK